MGRAEAGLEAFCHAEFPRLVGILGLYLGDVAVAEELAQETLVRVARRWDRVSAMDAPTGWTYRVARNLATSHLRRRQAARRAARRVGAAEPHGDPDTAVVLSVRSAVAELPDRQRLAIALRWFADMSAPEVADVMGISHDAVRSLTKRAYAALREELGDHQEVEA